MELFEKENSNVADMARLRRELKKIYEAEGYGAKIRSRVKWFEEEENRLNISTTWQNKILKAKHGNQ